MKFGFRWYTRSEGACIVLAVLLAGAAYAQDYSSMGTSAIVATADYMLKQGEYANVIPALEEVIVRMKEMDTPLGRETLQSSRFQLARAYLNIGEAQKGIAVLKDYMAAEPRADERMALRMIAQGYLATGDWKQVAEFAGQLLSLSGLNADDSLNGNLLLGQALFHLEQWGECIKPLAFVARYSKDPKSVQVSQIMTVRALAEAERWLDLLGMVRSLYRTDIKYDISLNLTLMRAGKQLFDGAEGKSAEQAKDDYLNALFLYRMVLPRERLIDFSSQRVAVLSTELEKKTRAGVRDYDKAELEGEINALKEQITTLQELPPYEDEVTFRIGQIYAEVKRYWEGFVLFDSLYQKNPKGDIGGASALQSVLVLYDMGESPRAEQRVLRYLDDEPNGPYARTLLTIMIRDCLAKETPDKVISLKPYLDRLPATSDEGELQLQSELHYMLAFAYMQVMDYARSGEQFDLLLKKFPDSPVHSDALYYRGMTYMMQGNYPQAYETFKKYQELGEHLEQYPSSIFREGICLFGMDQIADSEAVMSRFIKAYPDNPLVSEAYSLRGDMEAAKDGRDNPDTPDVDEYDPNTLDRALADYRHAIDKHFTPQQAAYAVFQAARVYELEFKWQDIIDLMKYYMDLLGEKADVAQAVFWIGRSQIELDLEEEAVAAYLDAIERFGNEVDQQGVDKIVFGLVTIANQYLPDDERQDLAVKMKLKLNSIAEDAEVLRLRLRVAMAYLEGEEAAAALGVELLDSRQELSTTTPISLALMCDAAIMAGDSEQMGLLFDHFLSNFEQSDHLWHGYRAKTVQLMGKEDYKGALKIIDEAQGLYGADAFMGWAQLAKGEALYKLRDYEESEKAYNTIMGVPEWRGAIYAQAMIGMAQCRIGRSDFETAHTYFQRTYLLFKSYDDGKWAADGYLGAADCLVRLGRNADAVNTLDEMLNDTYVNTLPQADTARNLKKKYGGA